MPSASSPAPPACRVLLVDDHPITRHGIRTLIEQEPGFVICAEADSAAAATNLARVHQPTVAIVDISLGDDNGLKLVTQLKADAPTLPVLVVSMHDEVFYAERARRAGAAGYVMKQHAGDRILAAIRRIVSGQTAFADPTRRNLWSSDRSTDPTAGSVADLSAREHEVLRLIGSGYGTREIATQLGLSIKTVDTYREHLKLKLNLTSGERLVHFAVRWANSEAREQS